MSIFDTVISDIHTYKNDEGCAALLINHTPGADRPLSSLSEDMDWQELRERGYEPAGFLTATAEHIGMGMEDMGEPWAHHRFRVRFRYQKRQMTTTYKVGTGWATGPTAAQVLESMISDYRLTEHESADSLGFQTPGLAEKLERAIDRQTDRLLRLIPGL